MSCVSNQDILRNYITTQIQAGFDDVDTIVEAAEGYAQDEGWDELIDLAAELTQEALEGFLAEQAEWEPVTDCDRLDAAFEAMNARGVIARQNFTCCSTCGHAEIGMEIDDADGDVVGYAFYHMQDTDGAVEGGSLYIKYGSVGDGDEIEVGHAIVEELRRVGLSAEWDGDPQVAVRVLNIDWKRRRPVEEANA